MSSNKDISHRGRIIDITPELTTVEIISESACSACHAKGLCGLGESKVKSIQVPTRGWDSFAPGDEVEVILTSRMGQKAVIISYGFPLVVMMLALFALQGFGATELQSGLGAIAAVLVYYFIVWLFRNRLKNEYIFKIKA